MNMVERVILPITVLLIAGVVAIAMVVGCEADAPQSPIATPVGVRSEMDPCIAELERANAALEDIMIGQINAAMAAEPCAIEIEETNARLDKIIKEVAKGRLPNAVQQSQCYSYQDFEPTDIEVVFLPADECMVEEEPKGHNPILYICSDDGRLKSAMGFVLDELKGIESRGNDEARRLWWVYIPQ